MYQHFLDIDNFVEQYRSLGNLPNGRLINPNGNIIIPVVVHVLHNGEAEGTGFNISQALIQSQIDVINEDFRRLNADRINTPAAFSSRAADFNIEFRLACVDPNGNFTNGVIRKQTSRTTFFPPTSVRPDGSNLEPSYSMKKLPDGDLAWPPNQYLNIWVCNVFSTLGYATYPQHVASHPDEDGVVISTSVFGRTGSGNFGLGRTATHEIGHWMNLIHIWGDTECGNDFCNDTPTQNSPNEGACPSFPKLSNCPTNGPGGDMFMNYMDYTFDACQNIFTNDQKIRARAMFATIGSSSGPRAAIVNNVFGFAGQPTTFTCIGSIRVSPMCLPVSWTVSGPATITFGQNTNQINLSATGNGTVHITATYGNYIAETDVTAVVGLPPSIIGSSYPLQFYDGTSASFNQACNLQTSTASVQFSGATSSPIWSKVTSSPANINWSQTSASTLNFYFWSVGQTAVFRVQASNNCGNVSYNFGFRSISCSGGGGGGGCNRYTISPNPASSNLKVGVINIPPPCPLERIAGKIKSTKRLTIPALTINEVRLYDNMGTLKKVQKIKGAKQASINITGLKAGVYHIEITDGSYTEKQQLVIQQ